MTSPPDAECRLPGVRPIQAAIDLRTYAIPHPDPFVCRIDISPEQIGQVIDHVSNIEYVRWLDRVAELHADSFGYSRQWLVQQNMMWFVARHEIDYLAEVWLGDELIIATWVRDVRKVKSWRDYMIIRPADQKIVCKAATLWVLVDLRSRRPIRMSAEMVDRFRPLHHFDMANG